MPEDTTAGNTNPPAQGSAPTPGTPPAGDTPPGAPPATPPAAPATPPAQPPAAAAPPAVPDRYEFQLAENSPLQGAVFDAFAPTFKELGLSQEHAQTLISAYESQAIAARDKQLQSWQNELKADKEFGGEKYEQNVQAAQKAVARFLTPEDKAFLDRTGLGNFPGLVKAFHRIGKAISEDVSIAPGNLPPAQRTAKDIYSHPSSQAVLK